MSCCLFGMQVCVMNPAPVGPPADHPSPVMHLFSIVAQATQAKTPLTIVLIADLTRDSNGA